ncbi:MAG: aminoacyl-tRNA hydrolase [bacterium]
MKYLVAGLGNIGDEYKNTRHNIGFMVLDALARASNVSFNDRRYGFVTQLKHKGRVFVLLKPSTYVNRSGLAVSYWLSKEKIPVEKLLIINDDIALPFGVLRLRPRGGPAGHNGLININDVLGHQNYARLRFGIGSDFGQGRQIDHVLGEFGPEEKKVLPERIELAQEIVLSFGTIGIVHTMNLYNNK